MPAHRKPAEIHELTGAWRHDPQRRRGPAPKSDQPIGNPPKWFSPELSAIWREIVSEAVAGVLTRADRGILSLACWLELRLRAGELKPPEVAQYRMCRAELGMTPVARTRLTAPAESEEASEFDHLFKEFAN